MGCNRREREGGYLVGRFREQRGFRRISELSTPGAVGAGN
jgi:hypothetical protein